MSSGQQRPAAPSGVVTFLFTDIEGSTRRWEADPDAMRAALAAHDQVLREAIETHGGWLFKHTGDGVCAAFASPRAAVDAAIAAQRALVLPVRMGIATGEAEFRDDDYFGAVLNRTARLMSAGHGGQLLLDGTTADMVGEVDLIALGSRRLRDIAKSVDVFQVQAPGLRTEFPPLKTVDANPGNLRRRTTAFVGRETEIADLTDVVKAHRLLTLTGVGGVGKTRLALELAAAVAGNFPDGVWVIELASVIDPAAVPDAVAAVMGITEQAGIGLADSIAAALAGRSRLLVFDNCEHVLDAAADIIDAIITGSSTVVVVATSREGLRLDDEQLWPVPSLDIHTSAIDLFVDRARAVAPGVAITEDGAVAEICRRLDGIPLAIELAASRMQSMTAGEIRDRLDDRFRLLVGSRRGLERHQTLRHAVQWSFDLLDDDEQSLLTTCSVFAGGFDLDGARAVSECGDELATLDLLDALVRKCLLVADRSSARTRYSMLETIRQFSEEQLVDTGRAEFIRAAHARYFAGRESDVVALWDGPRQLDAYNRFTAELPNLRTAFRWATDNGDLDTATAIAIPATLLGVCIEQYEPVVWTEELIGPAEAVDHRRLAELYTMAVQCYSVGRIDEFTHYFEAGRAAIRSGRYAEVRPEMEPLLGVGFIVVGQPQRWAEWAREIIARGPLPHTMAFVALVYALIISGEMDAAVAAAHNLPAAAESTGNPNVQSQALLAFGFANAEANPTVAYQALVRGLTVARESGNRQQESHQALILSRVAVTHGDPRDALDFMTVSLRNFYDSGTLSLLPSPLAIVAAFFERLGHHSPAAIIAGFAANPLTQNAFPEVNTAIMHLREALGDTEYESLASQGAAMTNAEIAKYAFDQIDRARSQLAHVDEAT